VPAPEVHVFDDASTVADEAAEFLVWLIQQHGVHRGPFTLALAGGTTPIALYERLATTHAASASWDRIEWYFGDERCVPPGHPDSNYRMAHNALFVPLKVPTSQIFPMYDGTANVEAAAQAYEAILRRRLPAEATGWPRFDAILLGLGDDGHTASLFPHSPALEERSRSVVATESPRGVRHRLTITLPVINHAHTVLFLVTGRQKAEVVARVLEDRAIDPHDCPAKFVTAPDGRLVWYVDGQAASRLSASRQQVVFDEE